MHHDRPAFADRAITPGAVAPQPLAAERQHLPTHGVQRGAGLKAQEAERRQWRRLRGGCRGHDQEEEQEYRCPADHERSIAFHCGEF
jgi:hypothetical protein